MGSGAALLGAARAKTRAATPGTATRCAAWLLADRRWGPPYSSRECAWQQMRRGGRAHGRGLLSHVRVWHKAVCGVAGCEGGHRQARAYDLARHAPAHSNLHVHSKNSKGRKGAFRRIQSASVPAPAHQPGRPARPGTPAAAQHPPARRGRARARGQRSASAHWASVPITTAPSESDPGTSTSLGESRPRRGVRDEGESTADGATRRPVALGVRPRALACALRARSCARAAGGGRQDDAADGGLMRSQLGHLPKAV